MVLPNPDVFIHPPYLACPNCARIRFGVNGVGPHVLIRVCAECGFKSSAELPRLKKRIVFVDQSALSNMLHVVAPLSERKSPHHEFWRALLLQLDNLVHSQLIACPFTSVHVEESMVDTRKARGLDWIARRLAADMQFEDRRVIELQQLVECAVAWLHDQPIVLSPRAVAVALRGDRAAWLDNMMVRCLGNWPAEVVDTVRSVRDEIHRDLAGVYERWRTHGMDFDARVREEALGLGRAKLDAERRRLARMEEIQWGNAKMTEGDLRLEAASAVRHIFAAFIGQGLDGKTATSKVVEFLQSDALLEVPFNRLSAMLSASVARDAEEGRASKNRPGRGSRGDFAAVSTSLPFCDARFVDNECARYLGRAPLAKEVERYGCRVFSLQKHNEFTEYLDGIEASASAEHWQLVTDIYGPMPTELPTFNVPTSRGR